MSGWQFPLKLFLFHGCIFSLKKCNVFFFSIQILHIFFNLYMLQLWTGLLSVADAVKRFMSKTLHQPYCFENKETTWGKVSK